MQVVARVRENGIQRHLPGNAVVTVPLHISAVRLGGQHHVGLDHADLPYQVFAEIRTVFQFTIWPAEHDHVLHAQYLRGSQLLPATDGHQLGRVDLRIIGAFAAVGA